MNIFNITEQSETSYAAAVHLSPETREWLQGRLMEVAQQKLLLTYDPAAPNIFMQAEAELQGRLRELMNILDAENQLAEVASTQDPL